VRGSEHATRTVNQKGFQLETYLGSRWRTTREQKGSVHVTVLLKFFDELRRRVPVGK
jgi:hypothetical protein